VVLLISVIFINFSKKLLPVSCSIIAGLLFHLVISTNLLEFTSLITRGYLTHHQTDVINTNFSKAFDSVNHRIRIYKLSLSGFPPNLLEWIFCYLFNKTQMVRFLYPCRRYIDLSQKFATQ